MSRRVRRDASYERTLVTLPSQFNATSGLLFGPKGYLHVAGMAGPGGKGVWRFDRRTCEIIDRFIATDGNNGWTGMVFDPKVPVPEPSALGAAGAAASGGLLVGRPRRRRVVPAGGGKT